jgi:hypothetical protein
MRLYSFVCACSALVRGRVTEFGSGFEACSTSVPLIFVVEGGHAAAAALAVAAQLVHVPCKLCMSYGPRNRWGRGGVFG